MLYFLKPGLISPAFVFWRCCLSKLLPVFCLFTLSLPLNAQVNKEAQKPERKITLAFVGDLMCHSPLFEYAKTDSGNYNFKPYFEYIKQELSSADITIGNLETVIGGKEMKFTGYPNFNTPDEYAEALADAGFDFLVTANNHSLDRGEKGIYRTLETLHKNSLGSTGTYNSQRDRDSIRILNVNGIKIVVLAYTYGTNGKPLPKGREYIVNRIDEKLIKQDVQKAKSLSVDIVIVVYHFGQEYKREPDDYQKRVSSWAFEAGANVVVGSHPHVLQPALWMGSDSLSGNDQRFIAYSMGNFLSNQQWRYSDAGAVLYLEFSGKGNSKIGVSDASFLPTWVYKGSIEGKKTYRILPATSSSCTCQYEFLTPHQRSVFRQSYDDSKKTLKFYDKNIKVFPIINCPEQK